MYIAESQALRPMIFIQIVMQDVYVYVYLFFFFNDTATTEIYTLHIVGSVRCVQETGTPPTLGSTLLRWLFLIIDATSGIGLFVMLLNKNNRRLGDMAAGTMVIEENSYKYVRVSLDEYDYLNKNYKPVYPEAANLTINQADIIKHTLSLPSDKCSERIEPLAKKVKSALAVTPRNNNAEEFLTTILHDYQYYLLEDI
eukprot:TRINITY_DN28160_c0_g1_i1.p1 TRINITY_DN28160_c0_g1~~TRINITY_DN28160_c0_g1_i1.p1  ORF type:complete len:198 (-),score=12.58 TRINITY_DN28160_c0_g1_i1:180-773(-)